MTRWEQIEEVLQAALDCPPAERVSFLQAYAHDEALHNEATSLVEAYEQAGDFIEEPAFAEDAHVFFAGSLDRNINRVVGPYTIVERIGGGGMGEVYLARDERLDRQVALKILPSYFAADDIRLRRFQTEARAASALNHPNILTIHEVGEQDDVRFIATEFIDGTTIRELLSREDLSIGQILDIVVQVALGLAAAHQAGIVHRDIKPENIMRRHDGLVKILDFGIAKLMEQPGESFTTTDQRVETEVGVVMGTADYMSPEQARGLPVDERTDMWSLGVVLYEMLAERLPFSGATRMDSVVSILEREPEPVWQSGGMDQKVAVALQRIVGRSLQKEPSRRYQSAEQLLSDLRNVRELIGDPGLGVRELALGASRSASKVRTLKTAFGILSVILAISVGLGVYRILRRSSPNEVVTVAPARRYTQMSEAEKLAFVSEQEQRISKMMGDRPAKLNDEAVRVIKLHVDDYITRYGREGDLGKESLEVAFKRAQPYVPLISRSFAARKVPIIIGIYLPMIESAYRNCYENTNGAKGLFQFMPDTARHYGVSSEEMCDVDKMTPAAAQYIADRMAELGEDSESLTLVLLSYNAGPEWVRDSLRELRGTEGYQRNFWTLFAHRKELNEAFRNESAGYVPRFFAAAIIGENPEAFGLAMPPLSSIAQASDH